jgi:predicted GNAT superfamily acetyltransferase
MQIIGLNSHPFIIKSVCIGIALSMVVFINGGTIDRFAKWPTTNFIWLGETVNNFLIKDKSVISKLREWDLE